MTFTDSTFRMRTIRVGRWLFADLRLLLAVVLLAATGWKIFDEAFRWPNPNRWRPAVAVESPVFVQVCGARGSWQALAIWQGLEAPWRLHWERRSYIGNAGHHHAMGIDALGFALVILPRHFNGGDYEVYPYVAVALPYWFFAVLLSTWLVCRLRRRQSLLTTNSPLPPAPV